MTYRLRGFAAAIRLPTLSILTSDGSLVERLVLEQFSPVLRSTLGGLSPFSTYSLCFYETREWPRYVIMPKAYARRRLGRRESFKT